MFTNNYDTLLKMLIFGVGTNNNRNPFLFVVKTAQGKEIGEGMETDLHVPSPSYIGLADCMGTARCNETVAGNGHSDFSTAEKRAGVIFGSGSTPAAKTDYTLESPIKSGLTITNEANLCRCIKQADGSVLFSRSYIVANTSDAPITIGEIGIFGITYNGQYYYPTLLERTVFASPATLSPGDEMLVTYKVTLPDWGIDIL